jgi:hypothetical protein
VADDLGPVLSFSCRRAVKLAWWTAVWAAESSC